MKSIFEFKILKSLNSRLKAEINLPISLFIGNDELSADVFIEQLNRMDDFNKKLSFFPFVWFANEEKNLKVGFTSVFNCLFPPFRYKMTCVKIIPKKRIEFLCTGVMKGRGLIEFIQKEDGLLFVHTLTLSGRNLLYQLYYLFLVSLPHDPYMNWRFSIIKKKLIYESKNEVSKT